MRLMVSTLGSSKPVVRILTEVRIASGVLENQSRISLRSVAVFLLFVSIYSWKREKIENIVLLLQGALRADKIVGLKMNVPAGKLDNVIAILPSLNAPTIANLYNTDWYSVETVISEHQVRELIPKLIKSGAEGIIEYGLNKVF